MCLGMSTRVKHKMSLKCKNKPCGFHCVSEIRASLIHHCEHAKPNLTGLAASYNHASCKGFADAACPSLFLEILPSESTNHFRNSRWMIQTAHQKNHTKNLRTGQAILPNKCLERKHMSTSCANLKRNPTVECWDCYLHKFDQAVAETLNTPWSLKWLHFLRMGPGLK